LGALVVIIVELGEETNLYFGLGLKCVPAILQAGCFFSPILPILPIDVWVWSFLLVVCVCVFYVSFLFIIVLVNVVGVFMVFFSLV
jgi:hypothetical protein